MIGMWKHNPTRFVEYMATCAMGEDLFNMRRVVRERATAIIKERKVEVTATQSLRGEALQGRLSETHLEPASSSVIQD
jgi:hypothetical protein